MDEPEPATAWSARWGPCPACVAIATWIDEELRRGARALGCHAHGPPFADVDACARRALDLVSGDLARGVIRLDPPLRHSEGDPTPAPSDRVVRLGV